MKLSIIIVNFNTKKLLLSCLESIRHSLLKEKYEVIVVDNASTDGSMAALSKQFPDVIQIKNQKNLGFAKANNLGVRTARGEYVLLLNSDTTLFPNTLETLLKQAAKKQAVCASCQLLNPDGTIQPQGGDLPSLINIITWMLFLDDIPYARKVIQSYQHRDVEYFKYTHPVGWVGGTALLVKKAVYLQLGGLDEAIFMYAEDVDFCKRMRQNGHQVWYFHLPKVTHLGQGSSRGVASSIIGEYIGIRHYFKKHHAGAKVSLVNLILKGGALLRLLGFGIIAGDKEKKYAYEKVLNLD